MIAWWWSWLLPTVGVAGLYLTTREGNTRWAGYGVGLLVQFLWVAYSLVTTQYGFLLSAAAYGFVNCVGLWKWWRTRRTKHVIPNGPAFGYSRDFTIGVRSDETTWRPAQATQIIKGGKEPQQ